MDFAKDSAGSEPSPATDINKVETLIESLHIAKSNSQQPRKSLTKNPFKRKLVNKQKRKLSICYTFSQCKDILLNLGTTNKNEKDKESIVLLKISDKMAKTWNEDGYRELKPTLPSAKNKNKAQSDTKEQKTSSAENSHSENAENHSQVSSQTCARQAMYDYCDSSVTELAAYLDETLFIPRKMSFMAEMMYT